MKTNVIIAKFNGDDCIVSYYDDAGKMAISKKATVDDVASVVQSLSAFADKEHEVFWETGRGELWSLDWLHKYGYLRLIHEQDILYTQIKNHTYDVSKAAQGKYCSSELIKMMATILHTELILRNAYSEDKI